MDNSEAIAIRDPRVSYILDFIAWLIDDKYGVEEHLGLVDQTVSEFLGEYIGRLERGSDAAAERGEP